MQQEIAEGVCEFHADNRLPLRAFLALQTQWRIAAGMGGVVFLGLEYSSIPAVLLELRVPRPKQAALIADLRTMEAAALPIKNAREPADDDG